MAKLIYLIIIICILIYIILFLIEKLIDMRQAQQEARKMLTQEVSADPPVENIPKPKKPEIRVFKDSSGNPVYVYDFKLVGSSSNNEDGTSRSEYLRKIYTGDVSLNMHDMAFEEYLYEGEPAIKVLANNFQIGNVPKEKVNEVLQLIEEHPNYEIRINFIGSLNSHLGMYIKIRWTDEN